MKKTRAYLLDLYGTPISVVETSRKSGAIKYGWEKTINGTPVNLRNGKLSRAEKYKNKAYEAMLCNMGVYIVEGE